MLKCKKKEETCLIESCLLTNSSLLDCYSSRIIETHSHSVFDEQNINVQISISNLFEPTIIARVCFSQEYSQTKRKRKRKAIRIKGL